MKLHLPKFVLLTVTATLTLSQSSCVNPSLGVAQGNAISAIRGSGGGQEREDKFRADQRKTVTQGTVAGGVVGGAAGLLLRERFGPAGVLAGAAIGGLIGNQVGQGVAKRKAEAQVVDSSYDGAIKNALAANRTARGNVASLNAKLKSLKNRTDRARSSGDKEELQSIKQDALALQKLYNEQIRNLDANINTTENLAQKMGTSNPKYDTVSSDVKSLRQSRAQAEAGRTEVASLLNSL